MDRMSHGRETNIKRWRLRWLGVALGLWEISERSHYMLQKLKSDLAICLLHLPVQDP